VQAASRPAARRGRRALGLRRDAKCPALGFAPHQSILWGAEKYCNWPHRLVNLINRLQKISSSFDYPCGGIGPKLCGDRQTDGSGALLADHGSAGPTVCHKAMSGVVLGLGNRAFKNETPLGRGGCGWGGGRGKSACFSLLARPEVSECLHLGRVLRHSFCAALHIGDPWDGQKQEK